MKRAVDLLGIDRRLVQEQNRDVEYLLTDAQVELLAKRAREEMRDACAREADRVYAETGSDGAAVSAYRIRNLPVEAAK